MEKLKKILRFNETAMVDIYKRPQGKGSPAVSYYPKGMLREGRGKGARWGFCEGPRGGRRRGAKRPEKPGPEAVPPAPGFLFGGQGAGGPLASQTPPPPPRGPLGHPPPPKGQKKPGPTLYGAGQPIHGRKRRGNGPAPWGKAAAHALRAAAASSACRGILSSDNLTRCCATIAVRVAP